MRQKGALSIIAATKVVDVRWHGSPEGPPRHYCYLISRAEVILELPLVSEASVI